MTHTQILLRELAQSGRTTYRDLMARYGEQGYTYGGFTKAVHTLRAAGAVEPLTAGQRGSIVAMCCPYCGRKISDEM